MKAIIPQIVHEHVITMGNIATNREKPQSQLYNFPKRTGLNKKKAPADKHFFSERKQ